MAAIPIYYVKGCADVPLGTDCNRLGTSRGFFNEIWVASACIARITRHSDNGRPDAGYSVLIRPDVPGC